MPMIDVHAAADSLASGPVLASAHCETDRQGAAALRNRSTTFSPGFWPTSPAGVLANWQRVERPGLPAPIAQCPSLATAWTSASEHALAQQPAAAVMRWE